MSDAAASLSTYERWDGLFPGAHEFSTLGNFDYDPSNGQHTYLQKISERLIESWNGGQFVGVLMHGQEPGTGKTHAAVGLARALHDAGADVFFRYIPELGHEEERVDGWKAPRLVDRVYDLPDTKSKTISSTDAAGVEKTVTTIERGDDAPIILKRNKGSVFPSYYSPGLERNTKTVLVLDDYKPAYRRHVRAAIEAASHAGGLIIMTSNFSNIFSLAAPDEQELTREMPVYGESDQIKQARQQRLDNERNVLEAAFSSRLMGGFVEVKFTGTDHRQKESFWSGMDLDPNDFV